MPLLVLFFFWHSRVWVCMCMCDLAPLRWLTPLPEPSTKLFAHAFNLQTLSSVLYSISPEARYSGGRFMFKRSSVSLGSQLQNIESLQTLHEFWSGFEPCCLLPLNAAVSPREEQPKGRACFCLCLRWSWNMIDVMSSGTVLQRRFSLCLCRMTSGFVAALIQSTKPLKQTPERHMERVQVGSITHAARRP